jgi:hypothetical protein
MQACVAMERPSQVVTEHVSPMSARTTVQPMAPVHPQVMYTRRRDPKGRQRSVPMA